MKNVVLCFLVGFTIFFVAGAIVGWFNRTSGDAAILQVAVSHTGLRHLPDTWSYRCDKRIYFDYDPQVGVLKPQLQSVENQIDTSNEFSFEHLETVFVAATGYELKGVLVEAASTKGFNLGFKDKVALAVGSITGYYAGVYAVTRSYRPACDDEKVLAKLQHKEYWDRDLLHAKIQHIFYTYRLVFPTRNIALVNQTEPLRRAAASLPSIDRAEFLGLLDNTDRINGQLSDLNTQADITLLANTERVANGLIRFLKGHRDILAKAYIGQTAPILGVVFPIGGWEGESNPDAEAKAIILDSGEAARIATTQKSVAVRIVILVAIFTAISVAMFLIMAVGVVIEILQTRYRGT
jgi:hypothetical protein